MCSHTIFFAYSGAGAWLTAKAMASDRVRINVRAGLLFSFSHFSHFIPSRSMRSVAVNSLLTIIPMYESLVACTKTGSPAWHRCFRVILRKLSMCVALQQLTLWLLALQSKLLSNDRFYESVYLAVPAYTLESNARPRPQFQDSCRTPQ